MRIVVAVPDAVNLDSAGVRIRYRRLAPHLAALGHEITVALVDDLDPGELAGDVYLISKCYDLRAAWLAGAARAQGKPVGIDIFDDYFTHRDSRLTRLEHWLGETGAVSDFALCATEAMAGRLAAALPGLPCHVLRDPFETFDAEALRARLAQPRGMRVLWFGMGDNTHFPVGLDDLAGFGAALRSLPGAEVSVLTNRRALTGRRLEALARLPVPATVTVWSLAAEAQALAQADVAFLPVGAQPFSTVKSLNRAVTALTAGVQVLSAGHPLYAPLDPFIYRAPEDLARDFAAGAPRLRPETVAELQTRLQALADPAVEAGRLADFLAALKAGPGTALPDVILFGIGRSEPVRIFAAAHGIFTAAIPLGGPAEKVDLRFEDVGGGAATARVSARLLAALPPAVRVRAEGNRIPLSDFGLPAPGSTLFEHLALYAPAIAACRSAIAAILPGARIHVSESQSPFAADA